MIVDLYIDVGNSKIKFAYLKDDQFIVAKLNTQQMHSSTTLYNFLNQSFKDIKFKQMIISSVVPNIDNLLKEMNRDYFNISMKFLNTQVKNVLLPIQIKNSVGADIVANAIYASKNYNSAIVISLGTATVISMIENKQLKGSIITTGLSTSFLHLTGKAAKLSQFNLKATDKQLALNTQDALNIGFIDGFKYMLEGFINNLNHDLPVLITGGDAHYLKTKMDAIFIDNMVLEGLKIELANL